MINNLTKGSFAWAAYQLGNTPNSVRRRTVEEHYSTLDVLLELANKCDEVYEDVLAMDWEVDDGLAK